MTTILDSSFSSYQSQTPLDSIPGVSGRALATMARSARAAGAPVRLGNITESAATSLDDVLRRLRGRQVRYAMLKTVADILPGHRVTACQKVPSFAVQQGDGSRGISKNAEGHAHFHGVGSCGDVWNCPICASRIAASRREEVKAAMKAHRKSNGACLLVTWTFPHHREDDLKSILAKFMDGMRRCKSWRGYKKAREAVGYVGQIRALEVTHGNANGWHPHCHEIWFVDGHMTASRAKELETALYAEWKKACLRVGLPEPSREHGIDVRWREPDQGADEDAAGAYVGKWGDELTFAHMKTGKKGSRSPWGILAAITECYSYADAQLFREYSEAFRGRAQLFWSRGLKDRFQIQEISDEALADRPEKEIVRDLDAAEWSAILKTESRCRVLEIAEYEPDRLDAFIRSLVDRVNGWAISRSQTRRWIQKQTDRHMQDLGISGPDKPLSK